MTSEKLARFKDEQMIRTTQVAKLARRVVSLQLISKKIEEIVFEHDRVPILNDVGPTGPVLDSFLNRCNSRIHRTGRPLNDLGREEILNIRCAKVYGLTKSEICIHNFFCHIVSNECVFNYKCVIVWV